MTLLLRHKGQQPHLERRILETPAEALYVSVVTAEELFRGALALIRRNQQSGKSTSGYFLLSTLIEGLRRFQILPFTDEHDRVFRAMPTAVRQRHAQDCRIAAGAMAQSLTVITRNTQDFEQIPGVLIEDWTREIISR